MATHNLVPITRSEVYSIPVIRFAQPRPIRIGENYFDRLTAFGLACLAAAIVGKLVMASLHDRQNWTA